MYYKKNTLDLQDRAKIEAAIMTAEEVKNATETMTDEDGVTRSERIAELEQAIRILLGGDTDAE